MTYSKHLFYMRKSLQLAKEAAHQNEVPVGSVIVKDDILIGEGFNKVIGKNSPIMHAEIEAIEMACKTLGNYRIGKGSKIYITLEPCHMCAKAILESRIDEVIFAVTEPKTGAIVSVDNFFEKTFHNHKVKYSYGILADESAEILRKFFYERRKRTN